MPRTGTGKLKKKKRVAVRNPVAAASRRVNRPKVERDKTKYRRKDKHKGEQE